MARDVSAAALMCFNYREISLSQLQAVTHSYTRSYITCNSEVIGVIRSE